MKNINMTVPVDIVAAKSGDGEPQLKTFSMVAYTGGVMNLSGFFDPVVIDIAGMKVSKEPRPILKDHSASKIVGHTTKIVKEQSQIRVSGVVSGVGDDAQEIVGASANGFPWRASVGASVQRQDFIEKGATASANGKTFQGPVLIIRKSTLGEISFVALAADDKTSVKVAAREDNTMDFEKWLEAKGFDSDNLSEKQVELLRASFDSEQKATKANTTENVPTPVVKADAVVPLDDNDPVDQMRINAAAEARRIAAVTKLCSGNNPEIEAKAIEQGWGEERVELELLRASRPDANTFNINRGAPELSDKTIEAATCLAAGLPENDLVASYGEKTMEAAYPMRNIGLKELVASCARIEGKDVPVVFGDGQQTIRAGFSTVSLPSILENVMNKVLLQSYASLSPVAFDVCKVSSVTDFKQVTRVRLLGTGAFEKVAPDGELKHGELGEQKYTNQAETYGQMLMLTRHDIVNDDLNAFLEVPRQMGLMGANVIDDIFFTLLLANTGPHFSSANGNFLSGSTTAFGPDSLTSARTLFRKHKVGPGSKAKNQRPTNVAPTRLLVPVELETDAEILIGSAQLLQSGSTSAPKIPTDNPHRNKYKISSAPHLSDSFYTGNSTTGWYLFGDPNVIAAYEMVFLNGKRTPTLERVDAPANVLGMGFRSWIDLGVKEQDPRGAVFMKGVT